MRLSILCAACMVVSVASQAVFVGLSYPSVVDDVDDFTVTVTVSNRGDEDIALLKDPQSPLTDLPSDLFTFTRWDNGLTPRFVGIKAKYSHSTSLLSDDDGRFVSLGAGESIQVEHAVSQSYDFSTSGPGLYSVSLKTPDTMLHTTSDGELATLTVEMNGSPSLVHIAGKLQPSRKLNGLPGSTNCTDEQTSAIEEAIPLSKAYIESAALSLSAHEGHNSSVYQRWFGEPNGTRFLTVESHYKALSGNNFTNFTFICNSGFCSRNAGVYAYVYPDSFGEVYLCNKYFQSPHGGRDSRASTLVHESSHFTDNGGTHDYAYGLNRVEDLARKFPDLAVMNADSHEYFAVGDDADEDRPAVSVSDQAYLGVDAIVASWLK